MVIQRAQLGLRARATLAAAAVSLIVAGTVSFASYQLVRRELLSSHETTAMDRAEINARALRNALLASAPGTREFLSTLSGDSESAVLASIRGEWFSGAVGVSPDDLPQSLLELVDSRNAGRQLHRVHDEPFVVVGIPIPAVEARYFELAPIREVEQTLDALARGLTVAAMVATAVGGAIGWYGSRRVMRPLRRLSEASARIAEGRYDTRLPPTDDADVGPLVRSFNSMAGSVQDRIAREERFTADAAHELRAPVAAMMSAIWVARRRVEDPRSTAEALDRLEEKAEEFRDLVLDLLELARTEQSGAEAALEPVDVRHLLDVLLRHRGERAKLHFDASVPEIVDLDRRRIGQAIVNLLDNAKRYGGGATDVRVTVVDNSLCIAVDDAGPGVPDHERSHIFERFARGDSAMRSDVSGSGLGLALVSEHARLHGGRAFVTDAPSGGARFVLEIPMVTP
jgi:signal transduction histidine kinase